MKLTENDIDRYFRKMHGGVALQVNGKWHDIAPSEALAELVAALGWKHGVEFTLTKEGLIEDLRVNRYKNVDDLTAEKIKGIIKKLEEKK